MPPPPPAAFVRVVLKDKTIYTRMATLQDVPKLSSKVAADPGRPYGDEPMRYTLAVKDLTSEQFTEMLSCTMGGKFNPRDFDAFKKYITVTSDMSKEYNRQLSAGPIPMPCERPAKEKKYELLKTFTFASPEFDDMERHKKSSVYCITHVLSARVTPSQPTNILGCNYSVNTVSIRASPEGEFTFQDINKARADIVHSLALKVRLPVLPAGYKWKPNFESMLFESVSLHECDGTVRTLGLHTNMCLADMNRMRVRFVDVPGSILCIPLMFPCTKDPEKMPIYKIFSPDSQLKVVIRGLADVKTLITWTGPQEEPPANTPVPTPNTVWWYSLEADVETLDEGAERNALSQVANKPAAAERILIAPDKPQPVRADSPKKKDQQQLQQQEHDKCCESCDAFKSTKERKTVAEMEARYAELRIVQERRACAAVSQQVGIKMLESVDIPSAEYSLAGVETLVISLLSFVTEPCKGLTLVMRSDMEDLIQEPYPIVDAVLKINDYTYVHADFADLYGWNYVKTGIAPRACCALIPFSREMSRMDGYALNIPSVANCTLHLRVNDSLAFANWKLTVVAACSQLRFFGCN